MTDIVGVVGWFATHFRLWSNKNIVIAVVIVTTLVIATLVVFIAKLDPIETLKIKKNNLIWFYFHEGT